MFGWLKRKNDEPVSFENNEAAFAFACENLKYRVLAEAVIPALVLYSGKRGDEGEQYFRLRLAVPERMELWGCTLKGAPALPEPGELVGFRVVRVATDMPEELSVVGYISCGLEPIVAGRAWKHRRSYAPDNIKPTVRF
ncbi:hypothetical protein [Geobacter sp. DSM 9736]|uniref:hypothetical protein n=1 Tax=Geobacter sp. DSM 9736 TaxID=1277350 RepID=UPI000B512940|nr:hypothetical protein [Geobacter sp. DSM 9736]SNB47838.1 hypothetical protein SAMN06269301_3332 [Geobacter sp. DSM 9736]